ncbi:MAG TPA: MFS transporter, partial [Propylenella sp.]|nr:MFS transporter [Propylenella sp.]
AGSVGIFATQQAAAVLLLAAMLLGTRLPLIEPDPELHRSRARSLPSRFAFAERDGSVPVAVQREFRIAPENLEAFLALMPERRRLRRRQGVRQWTLAQDVDDPEVWIERYQLSNWDNLQRTAERLTVEEESNLDEIIRLHRDGGRPLVRVLLEHDVGRSSPAAAVRPEDRI